ncbi:MAG: sugar phosphate isomerase/epimerase family protein, partial [Humibacter sp.]
LVEIGFGAVEPFRLTTFPERFERFLAVSGLPAPTAHEKFLADGADPLRGFETASRLGIGTVIESSVRFGWETEAGARQIAERINSLVPLASDHGVTLGYHNHWWEFENAGSYEAFVTALDPSVVLEIDTYWAAVGGASVPALLEDLGDRVRALHIKDGPMPRPGEAHGDGAPVDADRQVPAGEGSVDIPAVLAAAPSALRIVEFDGYAGDIFGGVAASFAYLDAAESGR